MLKFLAAALSFFAFTFGMTVMAGAEAVGPPNPPNIRYMLPGAMAGYSTDRLWEGRSIYLMEDPSSFYYGTDERGHPSGQPQNPRTGN